MEQYTQGGLIDEESGRESARQVRCETPEDTRAPDGRLSWLQCSISDLSTTGCGCELVFDRTLCLAVGSR